MENLAANSSKKRQDFEAQLSAKNSKNQIEKVITELESYKNSKNRIEKLITELESKNELLSPMSIQ